MKQFFQTSVPIASCLLVLTTNTLAQRAGQAATVRYGTVTGMQIVDLNNADALKGALVGGAFGAALTKSSKSNSRRNRNAAIGAVMGASRGSKKNNEGRLYTVESNEGTMIQIATEQTEIRIDDCVIVEESGGSANIRRTSISSCTPETQEVLQEPEMVEEAQEEAAECVAAKNELVNAETDDAMERAVRKIQVLCYN